VVQRPVEVAMESSTASRDTAKAMSEENVETARRVLETVSRDGPEAVLRGMPPEFVWDASPTGIPGLGLYRGPNEIRSFFEDWFKVFPFEEWEVALDEFIGHGDQVVVKARQRGRARAAEQRLKCSSPRSGPFATASRSALRIT
jgi:SnoaL-like domain